MGEPVLFQSMHDRKFGNPSDDKLMLEWLWEHGYALCEKVPDERGTLAAQPSEPVAWVSRLRPDGPTSVMGRLILDLPHGAPLYATPPLRTLTDEEITDIAERIEASDPSDSFWKEFARAIEAAIKEKDHD
jgi:hypothetical protein